MKRRLIFLAEAGFKWTSQSAACLAIDCEVAAQQFDFAQLRARSFADKQVLACRCAGVPTMRRPSVIP